jgi:hypothetical protein
MDGARPSRLIRAGLPAAAAVGLALLWGLLAAPGARAETLAATCTTLHSKIEAVATSQEPGTIVLTGLCTGSEARLLLPEHIDLTLEGAPGTNSGLNGMAIHERLIESAGLSGAIKLANLTVEEANGGGGVYLLATSVELSHDLIDGNTAEGTYGYGGGAEIYIAPANGDKCEAGEPAGLTVTDTTFIGDTARGTSSPDRGGGLYGLFECATRPESLSGDSFENDTVSGSVTGEAEGAGAAFVSTSAGGPGTLRQEADQFDRNTVAGPSEGNRGGGGEWLEGINLTSLYDRFVRNSIPGARQATWSWGGGLGILNTNCSDGAVDESTLENAVVEGNSIGEGTPADLGGAGIYVGLACSPEAAIPSHLRLLDSTVTENSVETAGGSSGIDGHSTDQLVLENSIVAANPNGVQVRGFTASPGSLTSLFSDACDEAGTAPLPGEGNICAPPRLADEGNRISPDVQETEASPTIDVGSNALVPAGLGTDYLGFPRILASAKPIGCRSEPPVGPPIVDMGAAEYTGAVTRGPVPPCPVLLSSFTFPKLTQLLRGALKLTFTGIAAGRLTAGAKFTLTRLVTVKVHGRRVHRRRSQTITLSQSSLTITRAGTVSITLTPSKRVRALLAAHHRVQLTLQITFTESGYAPLTRSRTLSDVYKLPPRPKKHHG